MSRGPPRGQGSGYGDPGDDAGKVVPERGGDLVPHARVKMHFSVWDEFGDPFGPAGSDQGVVPTVNEGDRHRQFRKSRSEVGQQCNRVPLSG